MKHVISLILYRFIIFFVITIPILSTQAQHGDNWPLGVHSGIKFTKDGIEKIKTKIEYDTNQTTYTPTRISVAYSDCQSNLVAYGNQVQLWNQHDYTIQNSSFRLGGGYFFAILLLPQPNSNRFLYYFKNNFIDESASIQDTFYCYLVDLEANNGHGKVVEKVILNNHKSSTLTYAQHANGKDIWILQGYDDKTLYSYLLTDTGIVTTPVISNNVYSGQTAYPYKKNLREITPYRSGFGFFSAFSMSNRGNVLISTGIDTCTTQLGCTWQYDFDNSTGIASNGKSIIKFSEISNYRHFGNINSACFSTNDSFCYLMSNFTNFQEPPKALNRIWQYNIHTGKKNIVYSDRKVFGGMRLAPDGRIYFLDIPDNLSTIYDPTLYKITFPNRYATACTVEIVMSDSSFHQCVSLPTVYAPYRPLYFYSNLEKSPCQDTATFELHVDTNFRSLTFFYGDGDSVHFIKPLQSIYKLKHKYSQNGKYYVQLKALTPQCDYFSYTGDSFSYASIPKRFSVSKSVSPYCKDALVSLKDSFYNATSAIYEWNNKKDTSYFGTISAYHFINQSFDKDTHLFVKWNVITSNKECSNYIKQTDSIAIQFLSTPTIKFFVNGASKTDSLNNKKQFSGCEPLQLTYQNKTEVLQNGQLNWNGIIQNYSDSSVFKQTFTFGSYIAVIKDTNAFGCSNIDTFYIKAWQKPIASLKINTAQQCLKNNIFEVKNTSQMIADSVWYELYYNNFLRILKPDSTFELSFVQANNYHVFLKNTSINACVSQFDTTLIVFAPNTNRLQILKTDSCLSTNEIQINITGNTAINRQQILWGDGQTTDFPNNSHRYSAANTYNISLISTTSNNCKDT